MGDTDGLPDALKLAVLKKKLSKKITIFVDKLHTFVAKWQTAIDQTCNQITVLCANICRPTHYSRPYLERGISGESNNVSFIAEN